MFLANILSSLGPVGDFVDENQWILPVGLLVFMLVIIIVHFKVNRPKVIEKAEEWSGGYDEEFFKYLRKHDIKQLILYVVFFALPTIFFFMVLEHPEKYRVFGNETEMYILIYFLVVTLILAIVRKDKVLLLIWAIPTFTLGSRASKLDEGYYDVTVYGSGRVEVTEHTSWFTIIMFILGIFLFSIKLTIILFYLMVEMVGNVILGCTFYPITYIVYIVNSSKELKLCSEGNYSYDNSYDDYNDDYNY